MRSKLPICLIFLLTTAISTFNIFRQLSNARFSGIIRLKEVRKMKICMKTLRKIPMALIGAADLSVCSAVRAINYLSDRGEKVWNKSETACCHSESCSCGRDSGFRNDCCEPCAEPE